MKRLIFIISLWVVSCQPCPAQEYPSYWKLRFDYIGSYGAVAFPQGEFYLTKDTIGTTSVDSLFHLYWTSYALSSIDTITGKYWHQDTTFQATGKPVMFGSVAVKDTNTTRLRIKNILIDSLVGNGGEVSIGIGSDTVSFGGSQAKNKYNFEIGTTAAPLYGIGFSDNSLSHGMTGIFDGKTFGLFHQSVNDSGGFRFTGVTGNTQATAPLTIAGYSGHASPSNAMILLRGAKIDGNGVGVITSGQRLLVLQNYTSTVWGIYGSGKTYWGSDSSKGKIDSFNVYNFKKVSADTLKSSLNYKKVFGNSAANLRDTIICSGVKTDSTIVSPDYIYDSGATTWEALSYYIKPDTIFIIRPVDTTCDSFSVLIMKKK